MSYLKDREIWLSKVPTGNPPAGFFWKFIRNGKVVVRDSSGNDQMMIATNGSQAITGSLIVTGGITGTISSASYVQYSNVANKPTLVSGSGQISFNGITNKPTLVSGSSQVTYSGLTGIPSGIVSGSAQVAQFGYATTSTNTFQGNQVITGSLFITQNLVVAGSSSIQYITSSNLDIADNIITVNTFNPSIRFGGLGVIDSGSSPQVSGSILFDSIRDQWIFVHQNQSTVTSSVVLMGPETYNNLGNETYLTSNRLPKGSGVEHLRDSNITDTGTVVSVNSNTAVTGSFTVVSGSAVELQVTNTGVRLGSALTDVHIVTGSLGITGSLTVAGNSAGNTAVDTIRILNTNEGGGNLIVQNAYTTLGKIGIISEDVGSGTFNDGVFKVQLAADGTLQDRLTITSRGAATFSSSVTANSFSSVSAQFNPYTSVGSTASPVFQDAVLLGTTANLCKIQYGNEFQSTHGSYIRFQVNSASSQNTPTTALTLFPSGAAIFSNTVTATRGFFSSNAASDSTTALLANASTNDSSTYAALFGSLNAGYRMVVRADGNVGIGINSPGVRLVNSGATLASIPTLGSGTIGANAILSQNGLYGLYTGVAPEGWVWQQVQRNDSNTAVYSLILQPSGGNVGIGLTSPGTKLEVLSRAADADRTLPHNILTLTAEQGNAPYGGFGGAILFKNRSYISGLVESSRIRSVIYDDGAPNNFGGGLWFETTPTPGGTLTPSLVINYQGRVGIGTNTPSSRLQVVDAATQIEGLLNISNTHSGGGVYYPAAKIRNTRGDHSYGIISEFSIGSVGGTDRPSILFYSDAAAHSWTVGQVTSAWGPADSFGIGYRANNAPNTFTGWPTNYFTITTSGNIIIGSTTNYSDTRLSVISAGATSATYSFIAKNSTPSDLFIVRSDGLVGFPKINDFTTGNSPNTWINPSSSYGIYINTSSIRYKKDIVNYDKGLTVVNQLRPVYYKGKSEVDGDKQFAGFIAEEIDGLGLTEFVNYLEDGRPNSLSYPNMVVLLTKAIQEQQTLIESLKSRIEILEQ